MKQRLFLFLKYYLFWVVFFQLQKLFFTLAQYKQMGEISLTDCVQVLLHAFPLDLSVASYITALFGLLIIVSNLYLGEWIPRISHIITSLLLGMVILVFIGDTGTFEYWGYHWDKSIFTFLQ